MQACRKSQYEWLEIMTTDWTPVFVLPNIPLEAAISCDIAALAPAHDHRVATLKRTHPMLRLLIATEI